MRRSGSRTLLLLGAVVALAVALVVYVVLARPGGGSTTAVATPTPTLMQVVAANADLAPYTVVTSDSVTLKDVDKTTVVLSTTATSPSQVIGMMTTRAYRQGDTI